MVLDTGSSRVGSPVYLVSIFIPPTVVVLVALLLPILPDTPESCEERLDGPAPGVDVYPFGETDGAAKESASRSSSSA